MNEKTSKNFFEKPKELSQPKLQIYKGIILQ